MFFFSCAFIFWITNPCSKYINIFAVYFDCEDTSGRVGTFKFYLHWSPKFYDNIFLFVGLFTLATFIFDGWLINGSVQTFQPLIQIYKRCRFVYHYWECTLIYRPLSYPYRSLEHLENYNKFAGRIYMANIYIWWEGGWIGGKQSLLM